MTLSGFRVGLFLSPKGRGKEKEKDFLDDYIVFNELNNYIF
jgi:hypothetical protein